MSDDKSLLVYLVASAKPGLFCSGLLCKVTAGNDVACLTTNHLAALAKLEPRLVPLVLAFRHWARVGAPPLMTDALLVELVQTPAVLSLPLQLCHIDCQAEGGIPSYSFALMVIFFLQQRKEPILPVYLGHWVILWKANHRL